MWPWRMRVLARNWPKFPNPMMAILSTPAAWCDWEAEGGDMGDRRERRRRRRRSGVKGRRGDFGESEGGETGVWRWRWKRGGEREDEKCKGEERESMGLRERKEGEWRRRVSFFRCFFSSFPLSKFYSLKYIFTLHKKEIHFH